MAVMYHTWLTTHVLVKKNSPQSCGNWPSLDGRENKNTWSRGTSIDDLSSWGKHWKGDVLKVSNPLFLGSHIVMAKQGGTWISWIHGRRRRLRNSADHCGGWWCQWYSDAPRGRSFPEDLWGMTYCGPVTCFYMSHQKYTGWLVNKKGTDTLSSQFCSLVWRLKMGVWSQVPFMFLGCLVQHGSTSSQEKIGKFVLVRGWEPMMPSWCWLKAHPTWPAKMLGFQIFNVCVPSGNLTWLWKMVRLWFSYLVVIFHKYVCLSEGMFVLEYTLHICLFCLLLLKSQVWVQTGWVYPKPYVCHSTPYLHC